MDPTIDGLVLNTPGAVRDPMVQGVVLPSDPPLPPGDGNIADKQSANDREEIKRLRSWCDLYEAYLPKWVFYLDAYEGGEDIINQKYLIRHPREHFEDYKERLKRAHYSNYSEPLCSFFTDYIYQETIERDGGKNKDFFLDFVKDVNRKGQRLDDFMREVCDGFQMYGEMWVLVDSPRVPDDTVAPGQKLSVAAEKKLGLRPYWVLISPIEILDWVTDDFDKLVYVKRRQLSEKWTGSEKLRIERFTEYDADKRTIKISEIDITEGEGREKLLPAVTIPMPIDEIPLYKVRFRRSKKDPYMGTSFLGDIAKCNLHVFNLSSVMDEFLYRQCFNILAMESDSTIPFKEQEEGETGTNNVLIYPAGGKPPQYIAPSAAPAKEIASERQWEINSMYRIAAQDMMNELQNGGGASGYSQHVNFSRTVPKIATRAELLEAAEVELMRLTMLYKGKDWDGKIKYKDRYEITNLTDALSQLDTIFSSLLLESPTFLKEQLKRIVHEYDGKLPVETLQQVESEIDGMDTGEFFNTMKLKLLGRAALAPEAGAAFAPSQTAGTDAPQTSAQMQNTDDASRRAPKATSPTRKTPTTATAKATATKTKKSGS